MKNTIIKKINRLLLTFILLASQLPSQATYASNFLVYIKGSKSRQSMYIKNETGRDATFSFQVPTGFAFPIKEVKVKNGKTKKIKLKNLTVNPDALLASKHRITHNPYLTTTSYRWGSLHVINNFNNEYQSIDIETMESPNLNFDLSQCGKDSDLLHFEFLAYKSQNYRIKPKTTKIYKEDKLIRTLDSREVLSFKPGLQFQVAKKSHSFRFQLDDRSFAYILKNNLLFNHPTSSPNNPMYTSADIEKVSKAKIYHEFEITDLDNNISFDYKIPGHIQNAHNWICGTSNYSIKDDPAALLMLPIALVMAPIMLPMAYAYRESQQIGRKGYLIYKFTGGQNND